MVDTFIREKSLNPGQLAGQSLKLLQTQWDIGPLKGHRGCCRQRIDKIAQLKSGKQSPLGRLATITEGKNRCRSNSCRPGDPFGCAMANARRNWFRARGILRGWLGTGGFAYVGLFETHGEPGRPLAPVLAAAKLAYSRAFGGGNWATDKDRYGIVGQIAVLSVSKSGAGSWIVRRWYVLGSKDTLTDGDRTSLIRRLEGGRDRCLIKSKEKLSVRPLSLRQVNEFEIDAVTQLIADCVSPLDSVDDSFLEGVRLDFPVPRSEVAAIDMAVRYRNSTTKLIPLYAAARRFDELTIGSNGEFGFYDRNLKESFTPVEIPTECSDFMEYAIGIFGVDTWAAYSSSGRMGLAGTWDLLVADSKVIGPQYINKEYAPPKLAVTSV